MCSLGCYLSGCEQKAEVALPPRPFLFLQNQASLCNGSGAGSFPWSLGEPGSGWPCVVWVTGSVGSWWWGQGHLPSEASPSTAPAHTHRCPNRARGRDQQPLFRDVWVKAQRGMTCPVSIAVSQPLLPCPPWRVLAVLLMSAVVPGTTLSWSVGGEGVSLHFLLISYVI